MRLDARLRYGHLKFTGKVWRHFFKKILEQREFCGHSIFVKIFLLFTDEKNSKKTQS